ncbi:MAG: GNAT family N-acetyltransferase [Saprospiraceae bacterium]|nr:GNAT family N-acetyltransferase [Saprospiraceae bacterium]
MQSPRLVYRKLGQTDFEPYKRWYTDEQVMQLITGRPLTFEEVDTRFAAALKTNRNYPDLGWYRADLPDEGFAGIVKLTPAGPFTAEVGYGLLPAFWGVGLGTEMLGALIAYASGLETLHTLTAIIHPDNLASRKILLAQAFAITEEGVRDDGPFVAFARPI